MNKREYEILQLLIKNRQHWLTAAQLSDHLSCSVRSIKTAVSNLNELYPESIISSRNGYRLGSKIPQLPDTASHSPETSEERKAFILRKLLLEEPEMNIELLAEKLFISFSTLSNELPQLKTFLQKYNLKLQIKKSTISITGSEKSKKQALTQLIFDEAKGFFNSIVILNEYFPNLDLNNIQKIVNTVLIKQHFYLNNYSLSNLLLHIAIAIERNRHGLFTNNEDCDVQNIIMPAHIQSIVDEICSSLSELMKISFSATDRYTFCIILYTRCVKRDNTNSANMLSPSAYHLTMYLCQKIKDAFDISMDDDDFLIRFGIHLENMIIRIENNIILRNPQLDLIHTHYPYIYDIAVFSAKVLERKLLFHIPEDEIGYIALHIGGLIEQTNRKHTQIHTILLYPGYYENGINLLNKLSSTFEDDLLIEELISSPEQLVDFPECQLVLTTAALKKEPSLRCLQISSYLSLADIQAIAEELVQIKKLHLIDTIAKQLGKLFRPELFFFSPMCSTSDEFLEYISSKMENLGFVEKDFYQKLKEREQISSSAIENIAIPHPIDMNANQSVIAVAICPQGILWESNRVNLIFTLAIRKEDRVLFRHIFELVTDIVMERNHFKALMKAQTYNDFIKILLSNT